MALQNEKLAAAATARNLEGKLADTEDCLLQKVREVASARDVQTGLRIELDSLKTMIENEEDRFVTELWTTVAIIVSVNHVVRLGTGQ